MKFTAACLVLLLLTASVDADDRPDPCKKAIELLSAGKQGDAERLIFTEYKAHPTPDNTFFAGVLVRSRFDLESADPILRSFADASPESVDGKAADLIVLIDSGQDTEKNFYALDDLSKANPKDTLLLWMVAVECRQLSYNRLGIDRYTQLLKTFDPGPALVHQTLGNLYMNTHQYAEALKHYDKAIELEPAAWDYNTRGNALTDLKRYAEAAAAYKKATELDPGYPLTWKNWALLCKLTGDEAGAKQKLEKLKEIQDARK